ncbi:unnamed protein product [Eruca vesicaria subsp. sativa]|uniref:Uncharacterized protein n=1 Tax=Eruca vesicaria subsp. sativa TaxID=29727 RepID=A0ABC8L4X6_ERUVS|nr:unnamed protein product [Eruca vesicaria subsp. sativa]
MYDVMLDEANLWFQEPPLRKRKLEPPSPVEEEEQEEEAYSSDEDMDPVEREKYRLQVVESCGFDVDFFNHIFNGIVPSGCTQYDTLFAKAGLHCHNLEKGKKLQLKRVVKVNAEISSLYNSYSTSEVIDPVDNSLHIFQTLVNDAGKEKKASLKLLTKICRIKPQVPGSFYILYCCINQLYMSKLYYSSFMCIGLGDATVFWDFKAIDDFYKTDMPDWPFNDGFDNPHLYKVKESELLDNEWLYLYAEAALFSEWRSEMSDYTPFEMKKVMVQTKEDVESSMKLKSRNAIFYMIFKVRGGPWCRGIVRKTSDGRTGHLCLEARCWIDDK